MSTVVRAAAASYTASIRSNEERVVDNKPGVEDVSTRCINSQAGSSCILAQCAHLLHPSMPTKTQAPKTFQLP